MALLGQHQRHRGRDQVVIVERALIIGLIGELRRRLDIGDQRRTALNQRDIDPARMQVLRDVVAAVAGADHQRALTLPFLAVGVAAGMQHRAFEILQRRNLRQVRNAADAGGHHDMPRMHFARRAVGAAQRHVPALLRLVIRAAREFGAGPEVELHAFDIALEPVGELVLRNVGRPVRRKRHIGQVVDLHLVVQRQRVIAFAPVVADARLAVDDQRVDPQLLEARGDRKSGMAAADHQHDRIAVGIFGIGLAQVEPVGAAEIPRIGVAARPRHAELLLVALEFLERGQQRPGFQALAIGRVRDQPQDTAAAALAGFKPEDRLDRAGAGAGHPARRGAIGIDPETAGRGRDGAGFQFPQDRVRAVDRLQVPAQRQRVAPVAVGVEQGFEQAVVRCRERAFELRQPVFRRDRNVVGSIQHSLISCQLSCRSSLRRFPKSQNLYRLARCRKGALTSPLAWPSPLRWLWCSARLQAAPRSRPRAS